MFKPVYYKTIQRYLSSIFRLFMNREYNKSRPPFNFLHSHFPPLQPNLQRAALFFLKPMKSCTCSKLARGCKHGNMHNLVCD